MRTFHACLCAVACLFSIAAPAAHAATYHVSPSGNDANGGTHYFNEGGVNSGKSNLVRNCVSFPRSGSTTNLSFDNDVIAHNCSWNLAVTANESDFGDLSEAEGQAAPRPTWGPTSSAAAAARPDRLPPAPARTARPRSH